MPFTKHALFPCLLGGTVLGLLEELTFDPKIEMQVQPAAGSLFPFEAFVAAIKSQISLKTADLTKVLDLAHLGIDLTAGKLLGTAQPSYFQYRKRAAGNWATGSEHFHLKSFNGFNWIERIEATQDDKKKATATIHHYCLADSSDNYLLPEGGQALLGTVGAWDYGFALGPLYVDIAGVSVQVDGNTKFSFESGIQFEGDPVAGQLFARQGAIKKVAPKISFSVLEILDLLTYGVGLRRIENLTQYLIAFNIHGHRIAPNVPAHLRIKFPVAKLMPAKLSGGTPENDSMLEYDAQCIGENVTLNTGVALP